MDAMRVESLTKRFGDLTAVDDISFRVEEGEFFGFLGPNGAGKTTTIRLLTGLLTPDAGRISIMGIDPVRDAIGAKSLMGVIHETSNVYGDLTVKQNLYLAGRYYGLSGHQLKKRSGDLLTKFGIYNRRDEHVRTFSKGLKQRVSIASAIIHRPRILFLDEPTEGLDVQSRRLIISTIEEMNEDGCTIFLTTHNIEEANVLCRKVCIINQGKIVAIDRPERLKQTFDRMQFIEASFDREVETGLFASDLISRVVISGDKWRLYTEDLDRAVKHVAGVAEKNDLKIISLRTSGPTLEDVFVELTGGGGR